MKDVEHGERRSKAEWVAAFGGKCQRCDYDRCLRALKFYHIEGVGMSDDVSLDEVAADPGRFLLLCANCRVEEFDRVATGFLKTLEAHIAEDRRKKS